MLLYCGIRIPECRYVLCDMEGDRAAHAVHAGIDHALKLVI